MCVPTVEPRLVVVSIVSIVSNQEYLMNQHTVRHERRFGAARRLALVAITAFVATAASAGVAPNTPLALYQHFDVDKSGRWMTVSVRLDRRAWRVGSPDGPAATAVQWAAAIGALKSVVIGTHCAPVVRGQTSYPCSFSLARPALDRGAASDTAAEGWWSTSDYTLRSFESRTVSAISGPQAPALPASLNVGTEFLGLIAPASFRERVAASKARLLRFSVRCGSSPAADVAATFGRGLLILSTEALEQAEPVVPDPVSAVGQRV